MSRAQHRAIATALEVVTYKPGWSVFAPNDHQVSVRFHPAACTRGGVVVPALGDTITSTHNVPPWLEVPSRGFYRFVYDLIEALERHEAQEWFRVDGRMIYDPHIAVPPAIWEDVDV